MSTVSTEALDVFIKSELARVEQADPVLPFTPEEYARRLRTLRTGMAQAGIDVLVITAPDMMCWLHGFACRVYEWHSSTKFPPDCATVVHATEDPMFLIDTAFHELLVRQTSCVPEFRPLPSTGLSEFAGAEDFLRFLVEQLRTEGWLGGTVGVERWSGIPNPAVSQIYEDGLRAAGCTVVDATAVIRSARRLKSPEELAVIERAQSACDAGLRTLHREARAGMTEIEAWHVYMGGVIEAGGYPSAIHETVCAGPMDAFGHSLSSHRVLVDGANFHADASATVSQYHARATRTFSLGEPPAELRRLVSIAAGAYDVVVETARVGLPFRDLNRALQEYYRQEGLGDDAYFGGGYELGLSFPPDFVGEFLWGTHDMDTDAVIEDGLVTNFESCAFVALIDTVVFQESGAKFLSKVPREVLVAGD